MNSLSYFIIFVILGICLFISNKSQYSSETFLNNLPSAPASIDVQQLSSSSLKINWSRTVEDLIDPIKGYIIMLKNSNDIKKGVFLNFKVDETCIDNCEYIIDNISLIPDMDYKIGVMAVNKNGGSPVIEKNFKTNPLPTSTPTSSPSPSSSSSSTTPTPTINSLDPYIDNMILRADGVYDWKGDYPDTYENDIKLSLDTMNKELIKDLQEYRVNVHIGTVS